MALKATRLGFELALLEVHAGVALSGKVSPGREV
jgi:hypothetical protein